MRDAWRLALGTLSIAPVRPPARVDRRTASRAMVLAPVVGLLLAAVGVGLLWVCRGLPPLLAATLAIALLSALTRGIHLDGLADTADGLGSGRSRDEALELMRRGDVGPFGVLTLVLVVLLQVTALASLLAAGPTPLVLALVTSRLALPLVCSRGIPAARPDGLGSTVAGSVSRAGLTVAVLVTAAAVSGTRLVPGPALRTAVDLDAPGVLPCVLAVAVPLLLVGLLTARCVRRLGGVTGDVMGACVEVAFTASLLVLAALPGR